MNTQKLKTTVLEFSNKQKNNSAYYEETWAERKERKDYYQSFTRDRLLKMTEDEFCEYISKLWSMLIWGNKKKSLRTWDSEDVLAVYDSLVRAHESINKLALVPESF